MTNITEITEVKSPEQYLPKEQLQEISIDLTQAIQQAKIIKVSNEEAMEEANAIAGKIRARQKGIENFRLAIVAPFKQHIAKIDRFFKDLQEKFGEPLNTIEQNRLRCKLYERNAFKKFLTDVISSKREKSSLTLKRLNVTG